MSPSLLIERLESLLPEIKRSGDPSGTLLKFAAEENLAPAQLEKMAQQYNTAKTLAYMNKAANRGGSFAIIDTEDLLARYTQPGESKEADDHISDWIDKPASLSTSRFPDVEILEMTQSLKAAAAALPPETLEETPREKYAREAAEARNTETLRQVREDFQEATYDAFAKFATALYDNDLPFAEIEDDAVCLLGKQAQELMPELAAYLDRSGIKVARMEKPCKRVLVRDRHGVIGILKEAAEAFDVFQGADYILKGAANGLTEEQEKYMFGADSGHEDQVGGFRGKVFPTPREPGKSAPPVDPNAPPAAEVTADLVSGNQDPSGRNHGPRPEHRGREKKEDRGGEKKEKEKDEHPLRDELGKGWDNYLEWGKNMRPIKGPSSMVKDLASNFATRNTRQEKIDTASDDTAFQTGVERLIHTDPILSEADPAMVADLASSIRSTNPQAALDLNYLKFTLREAVQYGALPHHTTKDLITMRKELAQAQHAEGERGDRLYGAPKEKATA